MNVSLPSSNRTLLLIKFWRSRARHAHRTVYLLSDPGVRNSLHSKKPVYQRCRIHAGVYCREPYPHQKNRRTRITSWRSSGRNPPMEPESNSIYQLSFQLYRRAKCNEYQYFRLGGRNPYVLWTVFCGRMRARE